MTAFPESGRSNLLKWPDFRVRFRPQADVRDKRKTPPERGLSLLDVKINLTPFLLLAAL